MGIKVVTYVQSVCTYDVCIVQQKEVRLGSEWFREVVSGIKG